MRKLASIQKIIALQPIDGADAIEKATVLGWQLVVKKNEFKVGDLAVYCEIDCLMPNKPEFEFLKPRGMRIRTVRLRGQISQGICFPISILPNDVEIIEDVDCTDVLGITKYEPPMPAWLAGVAKDNFPSFVPKTDETRVQVLQKVLDKFKGKKCYISEKLDGSSTTFYINNNVFGVCSRNLDLTENCDNSFWKIARQMNIENKLRSLNGNYAFQGELVGEGIQNNKLKLKGQQVRFFDVFDIDKFTYLPFQQFITIMKQLELPVVPIISTDYELTNNIDSIIKMSVIKSNVCNDVWAEGIVIRPLNEEHQLLLSNQNFNNGRVSFKAINPEFLLKYNE